MNPKEEGLLEVSGPIPTDSGAGDVFEGSSLLDTGRTPLT